MEDEDLVLNQVCPVCGLLPNSLTIIKQHYEKGHYNSTKSGSKSDIERGDKYEIISKSSK